MYLCKVRHGYVKVAATTKPKVTQLFISHSLQVDIDIIQVEHLKSEWCVFIGFYYTNIDNMFIIQ